MIDDHPAAKVATTAGRLPWGGLLALAAGGFVTILTEALPAGLLPSMSADLSVSEALIGQLVTLYAVGSLATAMPLTAATRGWRRRPLLLLAIGGFAVVNAVTALSTNYLLTLIARFVAGVSAGLLWALLAGYAGRMVPAQLKGRAIAVAMVGTPLALSLGIPAGTLLGSAVGWRTVFGLISGLSVALLCWGRWKLPDFPGQAGAERLPIRHVLGLPGIWTGLATMFAFVLAHNILYTYIAPYLVHAGMGGQTGKVLLAFGGASLLGIWIVGMAIDRWLRQLLLASIALFALAAVALSLWSRQASAIYAGIIAWGLAFGGAAALFQTASAHAAGASADIAQSMIVTVWNLAIAGGGLVGGLLLETLGAASFPWALLVLLLVAWLLAWRARAHGFPSTPGNQPSPPTDLRTISIASSSDCS